ncbi:shikimate dehydrogenase family protein [Sphingorhabdus buctiana]|uniref:Shikimate dehydrogenase (NADP(+)) n=1 Tax=Sphingorhabdus buctiana TaxID=1508805 RepID=A0ABW4MAU3_9SPHN
MTSFQPGMGQAYAEVIGDPIKHSKSPLIHGFWLKKLGILGDYRTQHVLAEGLADYFETRRNDPNWRGCNITIPHKIAALDHVTDPGGIRSSIGAINTVFRDEKGALVGTNTDAAGFFAPISEDEWAHRDAIVVGAGGAARAILFALAQADIGSVTILARSPLKAAALLSHFGLKGQVLKMDAPLPPAELLVNSSPLGMTGQPPLEIDLSPLPENAVVYDIVYSPLETQLLAQARNLGLDTVDGLDMLIGQAAFAFELLFGQAPPADCEDELRALLLK